MSTVVELLMGNDMVLQVDDLRDEISGAYLNAATVTVTLTDALGGSVGGATWPMTLTHVTGTDGTYRAALPYSLQLTANARYRATLNVNAGPGLVAQRVMPLVARQRQ